MAIKTNYVKAKIDNRKWRLCGDDDNNECSQRAQMEYKNRYNWAGKLIH